MPTFKITTSKPAVHYSYYEIEADTQEEAEDIALEGDVQPYDTEYEVGYDEEGVIECYEVK